LFNLIVYMCSSDLHPNKIEQRTTQKQRGKIRRTHIYTKGEDKTDTYIYTKWEDQTDTYIYYQIEQQDYTKAKGEDQTDIYIY
jgi:hypothetical protein